ncbi:hypothetical protein PENANT_c009G00947 [Penicillium antarcticum]|uniref:Uncharacterized protein n=1 Tax=Penicillium antarcticum TaxID=416450 RepID=A0A1V6Q9A2_9EURO|nr:hypothetical protein PENANT_c009G00947 [Penicillium antarcticum]
MSVTMSVTMLVSSHDEQNNVNVRMQNAKSYAYNCF